MLGNNVVFQESCTAGVEGPCMPFTQNDDARSTSYRTSVHSVKTRNSHGSTNPLRTLSEFCQFFHECSFSLPGSNPGDHLALRGAGFTGELVASKAASLPAVEHSLREHPGTPGALGHCEVGRPQHEGPSGGQGRASGRPQSAQGRGLPLRFTP